MLWVSQNNRVGRRDIQRILEIFQASTVKVCQSVPAIQFRTRFDFSGTSRRATTIRLNLRSLLKQIKECNNFGIGAVRRHVR